MSDLVVITYRDLATAEQAPSNVVESQHPGSITLEGFGELIETSSSDEFEHQPQDAPKDAGTLKA